MVRFGRRVVGSIWVHSHGSRGLAPGNNDQHSATAALSHCSSLLGSHAASPALIA